MAVYSIKAVQQIPVPLNEAWDFFSSPANLQTITPAKMGFKILSRHHGPLMYAGQLIEYKVKPVLGIPLYWMTEITQVVDQKYFIDEQRFGPYSPLASPASFSRNRRRRGDDGYRSLQESALDTWRPGE